MFRICNQLVFARVLISFFRWWIPMCSRPLHDLRGILMLQTFFLFNVSYYSFKRILPIRHDGVHQRAELRMGDISDFFYMRLCDNFKPVLFYNYLLWIILWFTEMCHLYVTNGFFLVSLSWPCAQRRTTLICVAWQSTQKYSTLLDIRLGVCYACVVRYVSLY